MHCAKESWPGPAVKESTTKLEPRNPKEWKEIKYNVHGSWFFTSGQTLALFSPLLLLHIFKISTVNTLF